MKFQNPSLNSVLNGRKDERTNGRTNGRTHKPKAICSPLFQSWGHKNQFLTTIKGRNSFANLRKTMIYNTNIDLVNDNVYTKFGLNRSISFQDIEQKPNSDVNQGP